jgi:RNA polymerase sigma-70 factor (ECF subfamily)
MIAESATTACHENAICDLVHAAQHGDRRAFGQLLERHRGMVYTTVFGVLRHHGDAEDVCQDVFVQAITKIDKLENAPSFSGWLRTIARNTAINKKRSRKWEISGIGEIPESKSDAQSPLMGVVDGEEKRRVRQALRHLREQDQEILIALYFDGQSLREISRQLEIPEGTVKSRLHAALRRAKQELGSMGFAADENEPSPCKDRKMPEWTCRVTFLLPAVASPRAQAG